MPEPEDTSAPWLQRLDNAGRTVLRSGRQSWRVFQSVLWWVDEMLLQSYLTLRQLLGAIRLLIELALASLRPGRPRFFLLDPSYQEKLGHYRTVANHLADECARRGWAFFHLTGARDDWWPAARLPAFGHAAWLTVRGIEPYWNAEEIARACRKSRRTLRRFASVVRWAAACERRLRLAGPSYYFLYTGDMLYLLPLLRAPALGPRQHFALLQFSLPLRLDDPREQRRFRRHAHAVARAWAAAPPSAARRLQIGSDSPPLRRWLPPALGSCLADIFPPLLRPDEPANLPTAADLAARPHPCGYFGYMSEKHGWPVLRRLLAAHAGCNTRWLLHVNPAPHPEEVENARALAAAAGAEICLGFTSDAEYRAALAACASVLLPYARHPYALVSSGKLVDVLRHGCLPIVPAGTWLAEMVQETGYGLILNDDDWPLAPEMAAALDLPALWSAQRGKVRAFLARYTAATLLDTLAASAAPHV